MTEPQTYYTVAEAANFLRYACTTLDVWRSEGRGPNYIKVGRSIRYRRADIDRWMAAGPSGQRTMERESECHQSKRELAKRPRGRAGAAEHARRLAAEPLCRDCLEHGCQRAACEIDHIIPIALGGTDDDDNIRCLCKPCHAARTKEQFAARTARE